MNARFPSIIVLGIIVAILSVIMSTWVFFVIVLIGGVGLAYVVWKLVAGGNFTPPTVLIDEARSRLASTFEPDSDTAPEETAAAPLDRTPRP